MGLSKEQITQALRGLEDPAGRGSVADAGLLLWSSVCDAAVSLKLSLPAGVPRPSLDALARSALALLRSAGPVDSLTVEFVDEAGNVAHTSRPGTPPAPAGDGHAPIKGLASQPLQGPIAKRVIAVGAGKGGVGKSTIAVNLAVGLARRGRSVGLLDADIYGPSMPTLLGLSSLEQAVMGSKLQPFLVHGVKAITIGTLVDPEKPLIWRGPMAHGAFKQLLDQTDWGELDDLIIDLPPGTGDIALTMAQSLPLTGAVVVCTPQRVAQDDAVRATKMFEQLRVPVLGVVENMSCYVDDAGKTHDIFGRGGVQVMAQRLGIPFLGELPLTIALRKHSDEGTPAANFTQSSPDGRRLAAALEGILDTLEGQIALTAMRQGGQRPTLSIS